MNGKTLNIIAILACLATGRSIWADAPAPIRPPAVPLITSDPYLSIWSEADRLTDDVTRHWTRHPHPLVSLIRIDGKTYRLMGNEPKDVDPFPQASVQVLPTRSIYEFDDSHVHVTMTFMSAALPHDLDVLARPLSYITWEVKSVDGKPHAISIFDSTSSLLAVNTPDQPVTGAREAMGELMALKAGAVDQTLLAPAGDNTRIDWGYAYAVAPSGQTKSAIGPGDTLAESFVTQGSLPADVDKAEPSPKQDAQKHLALAYLFDLGNVGADPVSRHMMVGYDEIWSIRYFGKKLQPYWRRNGATPAEMFQAAEMDYASLTQRCADFDHELMTDLRKIGGEQYAQIAALAYRQAFAACGLVADGNKQPLLLTKENTSNGDIATVDVFYPMDPMMVLFSPALAKATVVSNLMYAASPHWKFPNAPHDLGTYPLVTGRDDGGEGMPVEESGNMILLCDAIAKEEGNAQFVAPWWPQLSQWAKYLENYGLDPENQLCTDDFMGHLAHNANLSVKAILALAAYGDLCRIRGDAENAAKYTDMAKVDAQHWIKMADAGDHSLLAFDKPDTWSQKYNLVWDHILGLNIFPPAVGQKEIAFYKKVGQKYGVPLDSRKLRDRFVIKTDWLVWSATLADNQADFESLISPVWDYLNQTTTRDPLADSYDPSDIHSGGMHARPVVGGIFIKMLDDPAMWKKWSAGDKTQVGNWAPLPAPPEMVQIVPDSENQPVTWRYTTEKPPKGWTQPDFDDSSWKQGPGGFGTRGTPKIVIGTTWNTDDIWIRREFVMPDTTAPNLQFIVYHDEDIEIYVNGVPAAKERDFVPFYEPLAMGENARALLKPGAKITLAAHCHQTKGGQGIDVGLVNVVEH